MGQLHNHEHAVSPALNTRNKIGGFKYKKSTDTPGNSLRTLKHLVAENSIQRLSFEV